ncbi:MAG: hypothetical protein CL678_02170 [Bdellovibrionaceae bacterium]|nr:hypothetical protein [Pseudobdellovibrionaceae bacterium]
MALQRHGLLTLAASADTSGLSRFSISGLAAEMGVDRKTARRVVEALEAFGAIFRNPAGFVVGGVGSGSPKVGTGSPGVGTDSPEVGTGSPGVGTGSPPTGENPDFDNIQPSYPLRGTQERRAHVRAREGLSAPSPGKAQEGLTSSRPQSDPEASAILAEWDNLNGHARGMTAPNRDRAAILAYVQSHGAEKVRKAMDEIREDLPGSGWKCLERGTWIPVSYVLDRIQSPKRPPRKRRTHSVSYEDSFKNNPPTIGAATVPNTPEARRAALRNYNR